jgi:hypothetical protein
LTVITALVALTHYVNTYDDYDVSPRLDAAGVIVRQAMRAAAFSLGEIVGGAFNGPLERSFACDGVATHPCVVFIDWWTRFVAIVAQSLLLLWALRRLTTDRRRD